MTAKEQARAKRREIKENAIRQRDIKIVAALQCGGTTREIASVFRVNQSTIVRAESRLRGASKMESQAQVVA